MAIVLEGLDIVFNGATSTAGLQRLPDASASKVCVYRQVLPRELSTWTLDCARTRGK